MKKILILILLASCDAKECQEPAEPEPGPEDYAIAFARQMGEQNPNVTCVTMDTDHDGYVSCTIFRKERDPLPVECATKWTWNKGCRMQKPVGVVQ